LLSHPVSTPFQLLSNSSLRVTTQDASQLQKGKIALGHRSQIASGEAQPWSMRLTHWHVDGPVRDSASLSSPEVVVLLLTMPMHTRPRRTRPRSPPSTRSPPTQQATGRRCCSSCGSRRTTCRERARHYGEPWTPSTRRATR